MLRIPTAILISGRGSNMSSLLHATSQPGYPAKITVVLSNVPDAAGLETARQAGVEALAIDHRPFRRDRAAHEAAMHEALMARGVELVCLAGYMRLLTPFFVEAWQGRLLNIHPSLLPAFPGLHTHAPRPAGRQQDPWLHRALGDRRHRRGPADCPGRRARAAG